LFPDNLLSETGALNASTIGISGHIVAASIYFAGVMPMFGCNINHVTRNFTLTIVTLALCWGIAPAAEKISPVSDYQYKKDYAQYEGISKETDLQKRADLLIAFLKEHPISRLLQTNAADYMACIKPYLDKKDFAKAIGMEEAFVNLMPTEKSVKDAEVPEPGAGDFLKNILLPTQKMMWMELIKAYYQSNNLPKAADIGEKSYAASPDNAMAATLADIYLKMQNWDKYLAYGDKILAAYPIDQAYVMALQMAQVYFQKQDVSKGLELMAKVIDTFGDKTPPGLKEEAWNGQRALYNSVKGADAYKQKDYAKAIEFYDKAVKLSPKGDDSFYYYLGMSKWQSKDPEGAIDAFAKCVVLNKALAPKAKGYLEDLWKARHNNTLDGLDAALSKAKADLGIS
jgi:tetratricopeptide (TPR) repeat protein